MSRTRNGRSKAVARAEASGFWDKLQDWVHENAKHKRAGPRQIVDIADYLENFGASVKRETARLWWHGKTLPSADTITAIEDAMQALWVWIYDPATKWPPSESVRDVYRLSRGKSDVTRSRVAREVDASRARA